jgi:peptidoglycan/LPS O-acetylase OafA/YrhL
MNRYQLIATLLLVLSLAIVMVLGYTFYQWTLYWFTLPGWVKALSGVLACTAMYLNYRHAVWQVNR